MTCGACGARVEAEQSHCAVCGYAARTESGKAWSRSVEAMAYEDLSKTLGPDEALLGITRGRLVGVWRPRTALNPRAYVTPFANLGLTATRLLVQPISGSTGRAVLGGATSFPLEHVIVMSRSDADMLQPGRTVRLIIHFTNGNSLRLRATGRMAESADEMVEVWRSLYTERGLEPEEPPEQCPHCRRELDRPYRFCPFCGKETEA